MTKVEYIEALLRKSRVGKDLAVALLLCISTAYLNGVEAMGKKKTTKAGGHQTPDDNETPKAAFARLSTKRTNKALHAIGLVGQTSGPSYEYTEVQTNAIVLALEDAVKSVKRAFSGEAKATDRFTLPKS
ncbi:MAG: hypothetical protein GY782_01120 [Gammaproteobacteria bacterium]|nr:hypothetical protein [Gammaproteobacteria bacterium]